ncbi:non-canonical purine NTP pyrophosphatase, RdgB/HAM1 family [Bordetella sp. J329]|nr:non-canonical purine NTP pyrophosphatase, RdgB/HAM1 family [Bordetella sp. J329]
MSAGGLNAQAPAGLERIVLASGNAGKIREFRRLFEAYGTELVPQGELGVPEAPEPHCTFIENALAKARHASRLTGLPTLADDSGLCVPALGGAPGVYSARYAQMQGGEKSDAANNACLVQALAGKEDRRAFYVAVLVLVRHADDPHPLVADGVWHGEVVDSPRGEHGFGYDPHFFLPQENLTAAEMAPELKNRISHRARAWQALAARLAQA